MKTKILKVSRNSFEDKNGKVVSYCTLVIVEKFTDDENEFGNDYSRCTTKYEHFDMLKELCKTGTPVEIEFEFIPRDDGSFKRKPVKINGKSL